MSTSCFYKAKAKGYQPLSFLLLEEISRRFQDNPEAHLGTLLKDACTFCYGTKHGFDLEALAEDLKTVASAASESSDAPPKKSKSLGTAYLEWLSEVTPERLCMMLANWDMDKAEKLYCHTDHRTVRAMSEVFLELEWNKIQAAYECSMYGFGGGYKEDKGGDPEALDLTKDNPSAEKLIKSLGF